VYNNRIIFAASKLIPASADAVFNWHESPGAFERLTPPLEPVQVLRIEGGIKDGTRVSLLVRPWPFSLEWELEHRDYRPGRSFTDQQVRGPFRFWRHQHRMVPQGPEGCLLEDTIEYELPLGLIRRLVGKPFMQRRLRRAFERPAAHSPAKVRG